MTPEEEADRLRLLDLLRATHQFPEAYYLSVITVTEVEVTLSLRAAVTEGIRDPLGDDAHQTIASKTGKYTTHRFRIHCESAEAVLELYARVKTVKGVMSVL